MEPFLATIFFFLSTLKIITIFFFSKWALKQAPTGPGDACTLVISGELHVPLLFPQPNTFFFPPRVLNQANNEALHPNPHPLWAAAARWLACCV